MVQSAHTSYVIKALSITFTHTQANVTDRVLKDPISLFHTLAIGKTGLDKVGLSPESMILGKSDCLEEKSG